MSLPRILAILLFCANSSICASTESALPQIKAEYKVSINKMPTGTRAILELEPVDGDRYQISFSAKNWLIKSHELSQFQWLTNCQPKPLHYDFETKGLSANRSSHIAFDWNRMQATSTDKRGTHQYAINDDIVDELNLYIKTRCALMAGQTEFSYQVAYGRRIRVYDYKVVGIEKINTAFGKLRTLRVERIRKNSKRKTTVWVAPDLDYFMVKIRHIENAGLRGEVILKKLKINGEQVKRKRRFF